MIRNDVDLLLELFNELDFSKNNPKYEGFIEIFNTHLGAIYTLIKKKNLSSIHNNELAIQELLDDWADDPASFTIDLIENKKFHSLCTSIDDINNELNKILTSDSTLTNRVNSKIKKLRSITISSSITSDELIEFINKFNKRYSSFIYSIKDEKLDKEGKKNSYPRFSNTLLSTIFEVIITKE